MATRKNEEEMVFPCEIYKVGFDPSSKGFVVILKTLDGDMFLPISIGLFEGQALSIEIYEISYKPSRPMTYDLLLSFLNNLDGKLEKVIVDDITEEDTIFTAKIHIKKGKKNLVIDARPSDSLIIATKSQIPIFIAQKVFDKCGVSNIRVKESTLSNHPQADIITEYNNLSDQLRKAIDTEEYEQAGILRDKITKMRRENADIL